MLNKLKSWWNSLSEGRDPIQIALEEKKKHPRPGPPKPMAIQNPRIVQIHPGDMCEYGSGCPSKATVVVYNPKTKKSGVYCKGHGIDVVDPDGTFLISTCPNCKCVFEG